MRASELKRPLAVSLLVVAVLAAPLNPAAAAALPDETCHTGPSCGHPCCEGGEAMSCPYPGRDAESGRGWDPERWVSAARAPAACGLVSTSAPSSDSGEGRVEIVDAAADDARSPCRGRSRVGWARSERSSRGPRAPPV